MQKTVLRQLEDQLVKVVGRHAKRVHQGGLDGARYLGNPGLVVTAFDNVDFGKRHGTASFFTLTFSTQCFDGQCDALTAADAKGDKAARQTVAAHRMDALGGQHRTGRADRMTMGHGAAFDVEALAS